MRKAGANGAWAGQRDSSPARSNPVTPVPAAFAAARDALVRVGVVVAEGGDHDAGRDARRGGALPDAVGGRPDHVVEVVRLRHVGRGAEAQLEVQLPVRRRVDDGLVGDPADRVRVAEQRVARRDAREVRGQIARLLQAQRRGPALRRLGSAERPRELGRGPRADPPLEVRVEVEPRAHQSFSATAVSRAASMLAAHPACSAFFVPE